MKLSRNELRAMSEDALEAVTKAREIFPIAEENEHAIQSSFCGRNGSACKAFCVWGLPRHGDSLTNGRWCL